MKIQGNHPLDLATNIRDTYAEQFSGLEFPEYLAEEFISDIQAIHPEFPGGRIKLSDDEFLMLGSIQGRQVDDGTAYFAREILSKLSLKRKGALDSIVNKGLVAIREVENTPNYMLSYTAWEATYTAIITPPGLV